MPQGPRNPQPFEDRNPLKATKQTYLTLEHPIIGEIAAAIAELLKRTESLADTLAGIAGILASEGMLTLDQDEPIIDEQIAAADIDVSDLSPVA